MTNTQQSLSIDALHTMNLEYRTLYLDQSLLSIRAQDVVDYIFKTYNLSFHLIRQLVVDSVQFGPREAVFIKGLDLLMENGYNLFFRYCTFEEGANVNGLQGVRYVKFIECNQLEYLRMKDAPRLKDVTMIGLYKEGMPPLHKILPLGLPELYFVDVDWPELLPEYVDILNHFSELETLCFDCTPITYLPFIDLYNIQEIHLGVGTEINERLRQVFRLIEPQIVQHRNMGKTHEYGNNYVYIGHEY